MNYWCLAVSDVAIEKFSQSDLAANSVMYVHTSDSETYTDTFIFTVTDGTNEVDTNESHTCTLKRASYYIFYHAWPEQRSQFLSLLLCLSLLFYNWHGVMRLGRLFKIVPGYHIFTINLFPEYRSHINFLPLTDHTQVLHQYLASGRLSPHTQQWWHEGTGRSLQTDHRVWTQSCGSRYRGLKHCNGNYLRVASALGLGTLLTTACRWPL